MARGYAQQGDAGAKPSGHRSHMKRMDAVVAMEDRNQVLCAQTSAFRGVWKDA